MKITSKNLIIIMIMIFLIFNHFVGLAWEVVKTVIFSILFLYLLSFISPDLYESIMNTLNLKKLPFHDVFKFITDIIFKVKKHIPFLNKVKVSNTIDDETIPESEEEINLKVYKDIKKDM